MMDDTPTNEQHEVQGRDLSIPIEDIAQEAIGFSIVLLVVPILTYWSVWGLAGMRGLNFVSFLALTFALLIAHEGVHALGWNIWGGVKWSDLKFGIAWRALAPYCHARAPMPARGYRIGAALPGVITGVLPFLYGLFAADWPWALAGAILISGAVGDIYVLWVIRELPPDAVVKDHDSNAGCIVIDEGTPDAQ